MDQAEIEDLKQNIYPKLKKPADLAVVQTAAAEVDDCEKRGVFTEPAAAALTAAVDSKNETARIRGTRWVYRMAVSHPKAADLLWNLFAAGSTATRATIAGRVGYCDVPNPTLEHKILSAALDLKSAQILRDAARTAAGQRWTDLLPQVQAAATRVTDPEARKSIEISAALLRDGYHSDPPNDDEPDYQITVWHHRGIRDRAVPAKIVDDVGIAKVVRRMRMRADWPSFKGPDLPGKFWDAVPDPEDFQDAAGFDPALVAARSAYEKVEFQARPASTALPAIERGLHSKDPFTVRCAAAWLLVMAATSHDAAVLVVKTIDQLPATVEAFSEWLDRCGDLPADCEREIVRRALKAPAYITRQTAALAIYRKRHQSLLSDLIAARAIEQDPNVDKFMDQTIGLITQGFHAGNVTKDKTRWLCVSCANGYYELELPLKAIEKVGLPEVADRIRRRRDCKGKPPRGKRWDPIPEGTP